MVAALMSVLTPATAAPAYKQLLTSYRCSAPWVSSFDAQTGFRTKLEPTWDRKSAVKASRLVVGIVLPEETVTELSDAGNKYLEGRVAKGFFKVGPKSVGVRAVLMNRKKLPADQALLLKAWGQLRQFKMKAKGKYAVHVPKKLVFEMRSNLGRGQLTCTLKPGAPTKLTTIKIKKA